MRYRLAFNLMLLLVYSTGAHAFQPKKTCPKLPKDPVKAQILAGELFSAAEQKYAASRPLEALEGFLCSHHVIQHENTLFNIVQIAKVSQLKESALLILKDYVGAVKRVTKTAPIQDIIDELESEKENKEAELASTAAQHDGEEPKPDLVSLTSVFGKGENEGERDVSESGEGSTDIKKIISFVLIGAGGAALVAGGVMQGLAGRSQTLAEDTDQYSVYQTESDRMGLFQKFAIAGFINGGLIFGAGLALLIVSNRSEWEGDGVSFSLGAIPSGVVFEGRF